MSTCIIGSGGIGVSRAAKPVQEGNSSRAFFEALGPTSAAAPTHESEILRRQKDALRVFTASTSETAVTDSQTRLHWRTVDSQAKMEAESGIHIVGGYLASAETVAAAGGANLALVQVEQRQPDRPPGSSIPVNGDLREVLKQSAAEARDAAHELEASATVLRKLRRTRGRWAAILTAVCFVASVVGGCLGLRSLRLSARYNEVVTALDAGDVADAAAAVVQLNAVSYGFRDLLSLVTAYPDLRQAVMDRYSGMWRSSNHVTDRFLRVSGGLVDDIAISADGKYLVVGAQGDSTIRLWKTSNGLRLRVLEGHRGDVLSVAVSPDGDTIASGSRDRTARLWRVSDGALLRTLEHPDAVHNVAFSPDGAILASASDDGNVYLWNTNRVELSGDTFGGSLGGLPNPNKDAQPWCVAFSPDSTILAVGDSEGGVYLWQVSEGVLNHSLLGHSQTIFDLAFSPDGTILASASNDNTVRLWRVNDGASLRVWPYDNQVLSVAFSPDGQILAVGGSWKLDLWQIRDGALLRSFSERIGNTWRTPSSIGFSPDGALLISDADARVRIRQVRP